MTVEQKWDTACSFSTHIRQDGINTYFQCMLLSTISCCTNDHNTGLDKWSWQTHIMLSLWGHDSHVYSEMHGQSFQ